MSHVTAKNELEIKTSRYWDLSSAYNGRVSLSIPYVKAIKITEDLLGTLDPHRPLARSVRILEHELVHQEGCEPNPIPASISQLSAYR